MILRIPVEETKSVQPVDDFPVPHLTHKRVLTPRWKYQLRQDLLGRPLVEGGIDEGDNLASYSIVPTMRKAAAHFSVRASSASDAPACW